MKTAVVTGVSYGIGKSITETLLSDGWKVYGLSRSRPTYETGQFTWVQCDLSKPEQLTQSLNVVTETTIDALVSNAGVIDIEDASAVSRESYERTYSVNVLAPMLLVGALKSKIEKAVVITVSSVSDRIPEADIALYCSSKAANTSYFDSLSQELKNARIYALLPDYVETPMLHSTCDSNKDFDWSATIKPADIAALAKDLIDGNTAAASGSNIIIVTEKLKDDLKPVETLYSFNTDTKQLAQI